MRRTRTIIAVLAALALSGPATAPVFAQAPDGGFVSPFPEGDTYKILVFGESLAEGLLGGLTEALAGEARVLVQKKHRKLANIFRTDGEDEALAIDTELGREISHIAVVMLNPADRFPWRQPYARNLRAGSEAWKDEFDRRRDEWKATFGPKLDRLMRAFKKRGVAAYFVGLPILRRQEATDDAQAINELVRERTFVNGMKFIDIISVFADEDGVYSAQGPDLAGKIRQMRDGDGVHFTSAGYRKLAHFIERDVKRDIAQARTERTIPLLGAEVEQKRIRPVRLAAPDPAGRPGTTVPAPKSDRQTAPVRPAAGVPPAPTEPGGEIKAENARITLRSVNAQGREENQIIDILRPSIPANVVQLITRRESVDKASQVGDSVVTEGTGGLMLLSSVTPAAEGAANDARRSAPTNSPYFRALVKGERLDPKPGRADDFPWPRPEAVPQPRIEPTRSAPVAPKTTSAPAKMSPQRP